MFNIYYGLKYNLDGVRLALKTPKLLWLGLLRFFVVVVFTFLLSGLVLYWHDQILELIWVMPESGWMVYLWKVTSWIVTIVLVVISMVLAYLLSQLFFCVVIMDLMSRITEKMILGQEAQADQGSWFYFFIYLIKQEVPRAIIPVLITLFIIVAGLITPLLGPVIVIISSIAAATFLAWDNTDLTPARRFLPFKRRFSFFKKNLGFHIGFGLWFLIPGLNIIFLSFAPVGATLYYLKAPKHS